MENSFLKDFLDLEIEIMHPTEMPFPILDDSEESLPGELDAMSGVDLFGGSDSTFIMNLDLANVKNEIEDPTEIAGSLDALKITESSFVGVPIKEELPDQEELNVSSFPVEEFNPANFQASTEPQKKEMGESTALPGFEFLVDNIKWTYTGSGNLFTVGLHDPAQWSQGQTSPSAQGPSKVAKKQLTLATAKARVKRPPIPLYQKSEADCASPSEWESVRRAKNTKKFHDTRNKQAATGKKGFPFMLSFNLIVTIMRHHGRAMLEEILDAYPGINLAPDFGKVKSRKQRKNKKHEACFQYCEGANYF